MPGKLMLKVICMCAVLSGAIAGFLPLIPKLTGAAFTLVMFFSAPFTIIYLHRLNFIKDFELPRCLTIGALSGFISFIGFVLVYFPIAFILYLIFKIDSFLWIKVLIENIGFLIPVIVLTALLSGLTNMFSAFIILYFYEYLKPKNRG